MDQENLPTQRTSTEGEQRRTQASPEVLSALDLNVALEGTSFHVAHEIVDSSTSQLGSRISTQSGAREGENAFSRTFGSAHADGRFHRICFGLFKGKPACMICIDVSIHLESRREIKTLNMEMAFSSKQSEDDNITQLPDVRIFPSITTAWGPGELSGSATNVQRRTNINLQAALDVPPFDSISTASRKSERQWVEEKRWKLTGSVRRDANSHDHGYRIAKWILRGEKSAQVTLPSRFRLGIIVEHGDAPFKFSFRHNGSLQDGTLGLIFGSGKERHTFHFLPPQGSFTDLRQEVLENCLAEINHIYA